MDCGVFVCVDDVFVVIVVGVLVDLLFVVCYCCD